MDVDVTKATKVSNAVAHSLCYVLAHNVMANREGGTQTSVKDFYLDAFKRGEISVNLHEGQLTPSTGSQKWMDRMNMKQIVRTGTDGERLGVPLKQEHVNQLNNSNSNFAIVHIDTDNDGRPNHWVNIARDSDGVWQNLNNNRTKLDLMDFNLVYEIRYKP